jgi:hypothetical protein
MHVLYFHKHFFTSSLFTDYRSYEMARRLLARGHSVTVVCGDGPKSGNELTGKPVATIRRGVVDGINIIELSFPCSNYDSFPKRGWCYLRYAWCCGKLALWLKYDLLFAASPSLSAGIPGVVMKLFRNKPFVLEVPSLVPQQSGEKRVGKNFFILKAMAILEWLSCRSADALVTLPDNAGRLSRLAARARTRTERDIDQEKLDDHFVGFLEQKVILHGHAKNRGSALIYKTPHDVETTL